MVLWIRGVALLRCFNSYLGYVWHGPGYVGTIQVPTLPLNTAIRIPCSDKHSSPSPNVSISKISIDHLILGVLFGIAIGLFVEVLWDESATQAREELN